MLDDKIREALTFDDVLILPATSDVVPPRTPRSRPGSAATSRSTSPSSARPWTP
ncbi:MAG: hypothetical protein M0C28_20930 [Candidatus Moduliflexus flocculans]|nr:hypothetical protein [Candidatus Moduliflexus flocculans]